MSLVRNVKCDSFDTKENSGSKPLPLPAGAMMAKIDAILEQSVEKAKSTDAKSLVGRALEGTPDETGPFS